MQDVHSLYKRPPTARRGCRGRFHASAQFTVQAAAHGATAGFCWLISPASGGTTYAIVRRWWVEDAAVAAGVATSPRLQLQRMTFATVAGTIVTPAKADTRDFDNGFTFRTTTPNVPVAGAVIASHLVSADNGSRTFEDLLRHDDTPGEGIVLRNLEGLVWRQATAGSAGDSRLTIVNIVWEEYDE